MSPQTSRYLYTADECNKTDERATDSFRVRSCSDESDANSNYTLLESRSNNVPRTVEGKKSDPDPEKRKSSRENISNVTSLALKKKNKIYINVYSVYATVTRSPGNVRPIAVDKRRHDRSSRETNKWVLRGGGGERRFREQFGTGAGIFPGRPRIKRRLTVFAAETTRKQPTTACNYSRRSPGSGDLDLSRASQQVYILSPCRPNCTGRSAGKFTVLSPPRRAHMVRRLADVAGRDKDGRDDQGRIVSTLCKSELLPEFAPMR